MTSRKLLRNLTLFAMFACSNVSKLPAITEYCKYDKENTPCLYHCSQAPRCYQLHVPYEPLSNVEREYALRRHNELRNEVAGGAHANTFLPKAADMQVLSYDKECEFLAACYILQCIWAHDKMRRTLKNEYLGQNLFTLSASRPRNADTSLIEKAIDGWFTENRFMTPSYSDQYFKIGFKPVEDPKIMLGHMTQVIWGKTEYVGCAKLSSRRKQPMYTLDLYCNYKPSGNVMKRLVYKVGEPGTSCGGYEVNDQYTNLCGFIRNFDDDHYVPPIPELIGYHPRSRHSGTGKAIALYTLESNSMLIVMMMAVLIATGY